MKREIRILLLEDSPADVYLIEQGLKGGNLSFELIPIETESQLRRELETSPPDLVISDHGLPSFDGFAALEVVRQKSPDLPFIFVSGSNDQGTVCRMYERGATDYVYKKELHDLHPAVTRAISALPQERPHSPKPRMETTNVCFGKSSPESTIDPAPLLFCPCCLQAHDSFGSSVPILHQLRRDIEITFLPRPCANCNS